jgi:hypothetical protein
MSDEQMEAFGHKHLEDFMLPFFEVVPNDPPAGNISFQLR